MTARKPWFAYARPHTGKLTGWPIHPIGWALLLGVPMPGLVAGMLLATVAGKLTGLAVCFLVTGLTMWAFFRVMVMRGMERR